MTVGKVKWFSEKKGYGFIESEAGQNIFVHYSAIQEKGFKTLEVGQDVEFDVQDTIKGPVASSVVKKHK